jgi:hypothetical protein
LRPRGVRAPVLQRLVRTPRVSGLFAAALKNTIYYMAARLFSFRPSSTTLSRSRVQPWTPDICVQTRSCRTGQVSSMRPCVERVTRAKSSWGCLFVEVRVSIYTRRPVVSPSRPRRTQPRDATKCANRGDCRTARKIDTSCGMRAIATSAVATASTKESEDRREGGEGRREKKRAAS